MNVEIIVILIIWSVIDVKKTNCTLLNDFVKCIQTFISCCIISDIFGFFDIGWLVKISLVFVIVVLDLFDKKNYNLGIEFLLQNSALTIIQSLHKEILPVLILNLPDLSLYASFILLCGFEFAKMLLKIKYDKKFDTSNVIHINTLLACGIFIVGGLYLIQVQDCVSHLVKEVIPASTPYFVSHFFIAMVQSMPMRFFLSMVKVCFSGKAIYRKNNKMKLDINEFIDKIWDGLKSTFYGTYYSNFHKVVDR